MSRSRGCSPLFCTAKEALISGSSSDNEATPWKDSHWSGECSRNSGPRSHHWALSSTAGVPLEAGFSLVGTCRQSPTSVFSWISATRLAMKLW